MRSMIEAKDLVFEYPTHNEQGEIDGAVTALDHITLTIEQGEFVAVLGHNGSGKSTFAKHLNGILSPKEGVLWVNNVDLSNGESIWEVRKDVGMVFQNPDNQIVATIVEEDIAFGPENIGVEPSEIRKRVDEAVATVEMDAYKRSSPNQLSGGQKQRIAIAGVIAMQPKCIVFDESTAMLDPIGRSQVMKTMQKLNKEQGITIVHITHYMQEAILADRIVIIDQGKILASGTPKEVFRDVDKIRQIGLDVPDATYLVSLLNRAGMNLDPSILTTEEVVRALCQYK